MVFEENTITKVSQSLSKTYSLKNKCHKRQLAHLTYFIFHKKEVVLHFVEIYYNRRHKININSFI